jgi:hypothetical protein
VGAGVMHGDPLYWTIGWRLEGLTCASERPGARAALRLLACLGDQPEGRAKSKPNPMDTSPHSRRWPAGPRYLNSRRRSGRRYSRSRGMVDELLACLPPDLPNGCDGALRTSSRARG